MEYFELRKVLPPVTHDQGRIKVGTPKDTRKVSNHAFNNGEEIKVETIIGVNNQGVIGKIGLSKMIMRRTIFT